MISFLLTILILGSGFIFFTYSFILILPNIFTVTHNIQIFENNLPGAENFCDAVIWIITEEAVFIVLVILGLAGLWIISLKIENYASLTVADYIRWDIVHDGRTNYDIYRTERQSEEKTVQK